MDKQQFDAGIEGIFRRSMTDGDFRALALNDAGAAFKAVMGSDLPAGVKVRFVENAPGEATVVLPNAAPAAGELADDALEAVAGGGYLADWFYGCQQTCRASAGSAAVATCDAGNPH